jgi:hypothetical protein
MGRTTGQHHGQRLGGELREKDKDNKRSVFWLFDKLHAVFTMITFGETNAAFDESALDFLNGATMTQGTLPSVLDPRNCGRSHSRMFGEFFD